MVKTEKKVKSPELEPDEEEELLNEEDEGLASLFGKLLSKKLAGSKKKRMVEVGE